MKMVMYICHILRRIQNKGFDFNIFMKKFLKQFLFITFFSLSTLLQFIKLARGLIEPWHTVCFSSIPTKDSINGDTEQIKKVSEKYPQYFLQNTFITVRTEATNQTVYDGENPHRFTFRFLTLDGEKSFCIKSIQILNEDLKNSFENINFQSQIKHSKVLNGKNFEKTTSEWTLGIYSTPYEFNLDNYKNDIHIKLLAIINNKDIELTFILKRYERKGIVQWGY